MSIEIKDMTATQLYRDAKHIVRIDRKASTAYFQRKLKVNWETAHALLVTLENNKVIGKCSACGKREIF